MLCKWRFFIIFIFVFFFFVFFRIEVMAQFAGGVGTSESPYQISNCTQLQNIGSSDSPGSFPYMDDYFVLINNIDCLETETWNQDIGGTYFGFDPIYYYDENTYENYFFSGFLDGQNFTIDGLYINRPDEYDVGLFGYISGSTIINLNLTNVDFTGRSYVGGVASYMENVIISNLSIAGRLISVDQNYGSVGGIASGIYFNDYSDSEIIIDDCHFSGDINSDMWAGGLFGGITLDEGVTDVFTLTITNSSSSGSIDVGDSGMETGGLVGNNNFVKITNSNSSVNIDGGSRLGGLIGKNESGEIENCYSTGTVNGFDSDIGGLIGFNNNGRVFKSYSESQVSGNSYVGGLIGSNHNSHIENTYATGDVSGIVVGGLIGFNSISPSYDLGTIINSYASGTVTGTDTDGVVGGLIGYNSGDVIYNSYSVGDVVGVGGSYFGGFVGVFEYDVFLGQSADGLLFNNGWYKPEGTLLDAIAMLNEYNSDTYELNEIGSTTVSYEVSDSTEFYSISHQIYDVGVSFPWDFTTPVWYEWTNTYPLFIPEPVVTPTVTPTLTPTPTPTGTVLGSTSDSG
ncbi:MAG: GLUG motif-containing protein, partial [Candidatus Shapirobacteria bacterium]|nr:GLUG motif-containing protein [Candidatus Shapirobacteria bacterium]